METVTVTDNGSYGQLTLDMNGVPSGARLYMGLSGGADSAYLMWRLLRMGHPLLLHFAVLKTPDQRWEYEIRAVEDVCAWMNAQGLTDYRLLRTEFDAGESLGYRLVDWNYVYVAAGWHLRQPAKARENRGDITHMMIPSARDVAGLADGAYKQMQRITTLYANRPITFVKPFGSYRKAEVLRDTPPDLLACTWSCRRPKPGGVRCGRCHPCRCIDEAFPLQVTGGAHA